MQQADGQQQGEIVDGGCDQRQHDVEDDAGHQNAFTPKPVAERAHDQLADTKPGEIEGHDPLQVVFDLDMQVGADGGQGRQHRIDAQRTQRHQRGDNTDEFGEGGGFADSGLRRSGHDGHIGAFSRTSDINAPSGHQFLFPNSAISVSSWRDRWLAVSKRRRRRPTAPAPG